MSEYGFQGGDVERRQVVQVGSHHRVSRRGWLRLTAAGVAGLSATAVLNACGGGAPAAPAKPPEPAKTTEQAKPVEPAKPAEAVKPVQVAAGGFSGGGKLNMLVPRPTSSRPTTPGSTSGLQRGARRTTSK